MFDKQSFILGMRSAYPVCVAFTLMFGSLGMLGHSKALGLLELAVMSATIFAVPLQALVIGGHDLSPMSIVINTLILNFKFLLMSSVMMSLFSCKKIRLLPSLHFVSNSIYMVVISEKNVRDPWSFFLGVAFPSYATAICATIAGYFVWQTADAYQSLLHAAAHIVLPVHFICLTLKRKKERLPVLMTYTGIILAPAIFASGYRNFSILIWLVIAALFALWQENLWEKKACGNQSL